MKLAFLPISVGSGLVAGQLAKKLFELLWGRVSDEEAPKSKHREIVLIQLVLALLIEGAVFKLVRGLVDHGARHGWARLTGSWPGEERPEPE
jgi:Protein of unknown function (DUF4235)